MTLGKGSGAGAPALSARRARPAGVGYSAAAPTRGHVEPRAAVLAQGLTLSRVRDSARHKQEEK